MITPSCYQLEHLAHLTSIGFPDEVPSRISMAWLAEIEMHMNRSDPVIVGYSKRDLAESIIYGVAAACKMLEECGADWTGRFAGLILFWTLDKNGYCYEGDPKVLTKAINRIGEIPNQILLANGARTKANEAVDWLSTMIGRIDADPGTFKGEGVRVYVCSALTGLSSEDDAQVKAVSDAINSSMEEIGLWTHLPARYTNPTDDPDVTPEEIDRFDYSLVINSDLLIAFLDYPTTGGGKELAWAESAGIPVIVVTTPGVHVSRLVSGAKGVLEVGLLHQLPEMVDGIMDKVLERKERRMDQERGSLIGLETFTTHRTLDQRRVQELKESAQALANAPLWQVSHLRVLEKTEISALGIWAEMNNLSHKDTVTLAQLGQAHNPAADRSRSKLTHWQDWKRIDPKH